MLNILELHICFEDYGKSGHNAYVFFDKKERHSKTWQKPVPKPREKNGNYLKSKVHATLKGQVTIFNSSVFHLQSYYLVLQITPYAIVL